MPQAAESMKKLVLHISKKYAGKKIGVFCSNDDIACLFERQCIKNKIAVPETIELIGYDNSPISNHAILPITSIDQNISLMAQLAIQSLENYLPHESMVPAALIEKKPPADVKKSLLPIWRRTFIAKIISQRTLTLNMVN